MIDTERNDKGLDTDPTSDDESFKVEETVNNLMNGNESQKVDKTLSPDEMTAQGMLFFIAGYDTTSAAISHAIYYLSQYKECQQKLYEELQTITDFSYETLNKLKYLNALIKETLRLAPSLTRIQRECVADYKLGNTGIVLYLDKRKPLLYLCLFS
jgi:cytochrome P450